MPTSHKPAKSDTPDASGGFLRRWSELKSNATAPVDAHQGISPEPVHASLAPAAERPATSDPQEPEVVAPPPVTEADLQNLSYESDFTKFMGDHVPEAIRRQALRQLWRSDPILANVDGLCDYDDDFTDAARAVKFLKTAHRIGQGYLTDEEVAENRARGEPKPEQVNLSDEKQGNNLDTSESDETLSPTPTASASPTSDDTENTTDHQNANDPGAPHVATDEVVPDPAIGSRADLPTTKPDNPKKATS